MRSDDFHPEKASPSKRNKAARLAVVSLFVPGAVVVSLATPAFAAKPGDLSGMPNPGAISVETSPRALFGETNPLAQMTDVAKGLFHDQLLRIVSPPKPVPPKKHK